MNRGVSRLVSLSWMDRHHENEQCPSNGFGRNTAADQPSNENRPAIRETAEESGLATFESQDLADATRRFEEITGTKVAYYTGGHQGIAGFTPPSRPNLIFDHENRAKILEVAESHGIALVVSPELADGTRQLEKATGTAISYFQGGNPALNGFSPKAYPSLIFIRADRDGGPRK